MKPTDEQAAILDFCRSRTDNLLIGALAGTGKTSTNVMIAQALVMPIIALAFNKKIAEEMKLRFPDHVLSSTVNGLGHRTWGTHLGKKLILQADKTRALLKEAIDNLGPRARKEAWDAFASTMKLVSTMKLQGFNPTGAGLVTEEDFYAGLEEEPEDIEKELAVDVLRASIKLSFAGTIDFDDQIYMPTMFGAAFPRYPFGLVDEAQDLSPLNHAMLYKLCRERVVAVGDRHQSIYAFRGAMTNSMDALRATFNMEELPLNISFRCPRAIVEAAQAHAPEMRWFNEGGHVETLGEWTHRDVPDGAAIICRNNAPLLKCAFAFIRAGRGIKLVGSDIGPQLLKALRKLGPEGMTAEQAHAAIDIWLAERLKKSRAPASAHDRAACLRVLVDQGGDLAGAIAYTDALFQASGPVLLMTGHKAKGLEFPTVFHLNPHLIPSKWSKTPEDFAQEANVAYVITTRAKETLYHVSLEDFRT